MNVLTSLFRSSLFILLLQLIAAPMPAQVGISWVQPPGGVSIALDAMDNVYTVAYEQNFGMEMAVTKRDSTGALQWTRSFDQTSFTNWERASWITTDGVGNAIVCGTLMAGSFQNPVAAASIVMKFDPSGNFLWRQVYENSFDGSSARKCLTDSSSNIYVLGQQNNGLTKIKKFAPDGTVLWTFVDSLGIGAPFNFKFTPDGHLLISARSITGSLMGYAKVTLNGTLVWNVVGVLSLSVGDSAGDAFGNTYLVHGEYVVGGGGTVIKKLNPAGGLIWERVFAGMTGFRVEVGTDNQPVVSGFPQGTAGTAFLKASSSGGLLWTNLEADGPLSLVSPSHMLLDAENNAYVAASTMSEMAVCRVNADGSSGWTQTIPFGYALAIALARTGSSVYVVGGNTARLGQSLEPIPPVAPSGLTASGITASSADLNWTDNSNIETGFTLERCMGAMLFCGTNPGAWAERATLGANVTTFRDSGLAAQTAYTWRVKAFNTVGSSLYSNYVSATTGTGTPTPPAAPTNLTAAAQRSGSRVTVNLSWADNASNETGYRVERCTGANCANFAIISTVPANSVRYGDAGLSRRTTYRYRVLATGSGANSGYSNIATVITP